MATESASELAPAAEITEEDQYSEDLERRRAFWLDSAKKKVGAFLESMQKNLGAVVERVEKSLQKGDFHTLYALQGNVPKNLQNPGDAERTYELLCEAGELIAKKGFRFSTMTGREHQRCGSSGYEVYFDIDPDVPVPILRKRRITAGEAERQANEELMDIPECDRARRLAGKSTLDPETGRVTGEIDEAVAANSYYYLSAISRPAVQFAERRILLQLEFFIARALTEYEKIPEVLAALELYIDGKISSPDADTAIKEQLARFTTPANRAEVDLAAELKMAKSLAFQRGKNDHMLTPQEILVRDNGNVDAKYLAKPYVPLAVQDGASVEEISQLRAKERSMTVSTQMLGYQMPHCFLLEALDPATGETVKSPTFLDREDEKTDAETPKFREFFADKLSFPFARSTDWYYRAAKPEVV